MEVEDTASTRRFNFNTVCALLTIAFGLALYVITPLEVARPRLIFGQAPSGLDPFIFPRAVAVFIVLVGLWYLGSSFRLRERNEFLDQTWSGTFVVGVTVIGFLALALLFEPLGFVIPSAILIFALSTFYGNRSYLLALAVAVLVPLLVYNIFTKGFRVYLPPFPYADLVWL